MTTPMRTLALTSAGQRRRSRQVRRQKLGRNPKRTRYLQSSTIGAGTYGTVTRLSHPLQKSEHRSTAHDSLDSFEKTQWRDFSSLTMISSNIRLRNVVVLVCVVSCVVKVWWWLDCGVNKISRRSRRRSSRRVRWQRWSNLFTRHFTSTPT